MTDDVPSISASGSVPSLGPGLVQLGLGLRGESLRLDLELCGCGPAVGSRGDGGRPLALQVSQGGPVLSQLSVELGPEGEEKG